MLQPLRLESTVLSLAMRSNSTLVSCTHTVHLLHTAVRRPHTVLRCTVLKYSRTQTEPVPAAHTAVQIVRFRHSTVFRLYSHSSRIFSLPVTEIRCSLWLRLPMVIGPGSPGKNLRFSSGFEPRTCCSYHIIVNLRV